jgi:hypothetical protein
VRHVRVLRQRHRSCQDKTLLSRQIDAMDAAIDKLVYELYGLMMKV